MKKVLIISYFFPPCNLTAAQRIKGWAEHLHKFGYYPTIVTRNWNISIKSPEDMLKSSGSEVIHKKNKKFEIYYLPYKAGLKDRMFTRFSGSKLQVLSKPFTLWEVLMENFTTRFIPHKNLYNFSKKIIREEKFSKLVISGNPFDQFQFGYKLNKEFNIKWGADYRDDWTTSELDSNISTIIQKIQRKSETKWINSASIFTSVSPFYVDKIEKITKTKGKVLLNGFDKIRKTQHKKNETLTITYNGSLYSTQPVELFLDACIKLISNGIQLKINFIGTGFDPIQKKRIENYSPTLKQFLNITNRIERKKVLEIQQKSDILLMIPHTNLKGIPSSKLYEYISMFKPILCCPNDNDIVESTLLDTGLGLICKNASEIENTIINFIENDELIDPNEFSILKYSREHQTELLAKFLNEL